MVAITDEIIGVTQLSGNVPGLPQRIRLWIHGWTRRIARERQTERQSEKDRETERDGEK